MADDTSPKRETPPTLDVATAAKLDLVQRMFEAGFAEAVARVAGILGPDKDVSMGSALACQQAAHEQAMSQIVAVISTSDDDVEQVAQRFTRRIVDLALKHRQSGFFKMMGQAEGVRFDA